MITLARFILKGPSQAALVAAAMAILGLVFMPAIWFSSAAIALVVLVQGAKQGARVMGFAIAGACLLSWLVLGRPELALVFVLIAWLPVWIPAVALRQTVSLAISLLLITAMAVAGTVLFYMMLPGFEAGYTELISEVILQLIQQYRVQLDAAQTAEVTAMVVRLLPGLFMSSLLFGAVAGLFLARWWQARLYNPGGFGKEFRELRLGRSSALIAIAVTALALTLQTELMIGLLMQVFTLYLLQGTSLLHALVNGMKLNSVWLFVIYALIFFVPHVVVLMVLAGITDAWIDIRRLLIPGNDQA